MKDMVRKAGLENRFVIESKAARRDELGNDTHYGTKAKLRQMGVPFAKRRATLLDRSDYDAYDYLIGMDEENMRDMLRLFGGDPNGKIYKLLRFADEDRDVADPWYWEKVKFVETAAIRALRVSETAPVRKGGDLCLLKLLKVH